MEQAAVAGMMALSIAMMMRRPGTFSPALAGAELAPWKPTSPGDDEQQPETDRAPRKVLPWAVAGIAAARLACFAVLGA